MRLGHPNQRRLQRYRTPGVNAVRSCSDGMRAAKDRAYTSARGTVVVDGPSRDSVVVRLNRSPWSPSPLPLSRPTGEGVDDARLQASAHPGSRRPRFSRCAFKVRPALDSERPRKPIRPWSCPNGRRPFDCGFHPVFTASGDCPLPIARKTPRTSALRVFAWPPKPETNRINEARACSTLSLWERAGVRGPVR